MRREIVISKAHAISSLRGALLGERVADVYHDLTGGKISEAREANGRVFMYGRLALPDFPSNGVYTAVTVAGDSAAMAVMEMGESRHFDLTGGLLNHPRTITGVETGYFTMEGQPLSLQLVERGDLDDVRKLAVIKPYQGSEYTWKFALHGVVSGRIQTALAQDIKPEWIHT